MGFVERINFVVVSGVDSFVKPVVAIVLAVDGKTVDVGVKVIVDCVCVVGWYVDWLDGLVENITVKGFL